MSTRLKALIVLGAGAMLIAACREYRGAVREYRGAVREWERSPEREDQGHSSHQGHGRFLGCHDRGRQAV